MKTHVTILNKYCLLCALKPGSQMMCNREQYWDKLSRKSYIYTYKLKVYCNILRLSIQIRRNEGGDEQNLRKRRTNRNSVYSSALIISDVHEVPLSENHAGAPTDFSSGNRWKAPLNSHTIKRSMGQMQQLLRGISSIDCLQPQYHLFSQLLTPCIGLYIGHSITCSSHCRMRPVSFCHWKSNPPLGINSILFPLCL